MEARLLIQLEFNSKNILGWLRLLLEVYPLSREDRFAIKRYLHRGDKITRDKELRRLFGY